MNELRTSGDPRPADASHAELTDIARLAYLYGLPAYEVARLRYRALSLARKGGEPMRLNTFWHTKGLATPATSDVTAVNSDTLLSRAWIDVSHGPLIIQLPDAGARYYGLALMDVFTNNFAVVGPRTVSGIDGRILLVDSLWDGVAPAGMTLIRAPTNAVWALARVLVDGPDDVAAVRLVQEQFRLSRWGPPSPRTRPSADPLSRPVLPSDGTKPLVFFDVLNAVLTENPPPPDDGPVLERLARIGVGPGLQFRRRDFTEPQLGALRRGLASAQEALRAQVGFRTEGGRQPVPGDGPSDVLLARMRPGAAAAAKTTDRRHGWSGPVGEVGRFGTDYRLRAQCALAGLGLLPRQEALYFTTATDAAGAILDGHNRYVLRFPRNGLPPVHAFWSLTIYRTDENNRRWLVPNAIDRYSIGNRKLDLHVAADGTVEIAIQHEAPDAHGENWLPSPQAQFMLTLRAYRPGDALLDGRYVIPDVRRI